MNDRSADLKMGATLMRGELLEIPRRLEEQLFRNTGLVDEVAAAVRRFNPGQQFVAGRGTSSHAGLFLRYVMGMQAGWLIGDLSLSIFTVYGRHAHLDRPLIVGISQSGAGKDVLAGIAHVSESGGLSLAVTNDSDSPLARRADYHLPIHMGVERAVAATKTFIGTLTTLLYLAARLQEDRALEDALRRLPTLLAGMDSSVWESAATAAFQQLSSPMFVISRGLGLALAREAALKLKETCNVHAEAYSAAEFRHGPLVLVDEACPVLMLCLDDETRPGVLDLAHELAGLKAPVCLVGPNLEGQGDTAGLRVVETPSTGNVYTDAVAAAFLMYDGVEVLSVARGLDPDQPRHLDKVTSTF